MLHSCDREPNKGYRSSGDNGVRTRSYPKYAVQRRSRSHPLLAWSQWGLSYRRRMRYILHYPWLWCRCPNAAAIVACTRMRSNIKSKRDLRCKDISIVQCSMKRCPTALLVNEIDIDCWVFEQWAEILSMVYWRWHEMQDTPSKPIPAIHVYTEQSLLLVRGLGLEVALVLVLQQDAPEQRKIVCVKGVMQQAHAVSDKSWAIKW